MKGPISFLTSQKVPQIYTIYTAHAPPGHRDVWKSAGQLCRSLRQTESNDRIPPPRLLPGRVKSHFLYRTIVLVCGLVRLAQPETHMPIVQKRQAEGQRQQIEEVVVARQNDEKLKQHLLNGRKQLDRENGCRLISDFKSALNRQPNYHYDDTYDARFV